MRRGRSVFRWLAALVIALAIVVATAPWWLGASGRFLVKADGPAPADMVVVLAGDFSGNRILTAGDLVRRGLAPHALVSGPSGAYGMHESDLAIHRAGLERWLAMPEGFWGTTRLSDSRAH